MADVPFGDAVVDVDDDDDDDDDEDDEAEEEEGEEEEGEEEDDDDDGEEDESEEVEGEGEGEEDLDYFREDGEEDQDDDDDEASSDDDDDDDDEDAEEDADDGKASAATGSMSAAGEAPPAEESDSEDEMPVNTIGNVPLEWYDDFDHVGYDLDGQKIMRGTRKDELDALIARFDDPNAKRTVHDYLHGVDVVLSEADVALIKRLQKRRYIDPNMNPYPDAVHYEYEDKLHPLSSKHPAKASFIPSKWEAKKVMKLVMAMRSEQYQKSVENRRKQDAKNKPDYQYLVWDEKGEQVKHHKRLPPPKVALPGNAESYNPPAEYLYTPEELAAWEAMDPSDRPLNFIPQRFKALRHVPLYNPLIKERFDRCLDLYLCPREVKNRLQIDPDSLLPQLPKPAELRPFPERLSFSYEGHTGRVYSVSVDPTGEWLLTGSADGSVKLWEVATARCEKTWALGAEVRRLLSAASPLVRQRPPRPCCPAELGCLASVFPSSYGPFCLSLAGRPRGLHAPLSARAPVHCLLPGALRRLLPECRSTHGRRRRRHAAHAAAAGRAPRAAERQGARSAQQQRQRRERRRWLGRRRRLAARAGHHVDGGTREERLDMHVAPRRRLPGERVSRGRDEGRAAAPGVQALDRQPLLQVQGTHRDGRLPPVQVRRRALPPIAADCHRLPPIAVHCRRLPPIGTDCLRLPLVAWPSHMKSIDDESEAAWGDLRRRLMTIEAFVG